MEGGRPGTDACRSRGLTRRGRGGSRRALPGACPRTSADGAALGGVGLGLRCLRGVRVAGEEAQSHLTQALMGPRDTVLEQADLLAEPVLADTRVVIDLARGSSGLLDHRLPLLPCVGEDPL